MTSTKYVPIAAALAALALAGPASAGFGDKDNGVPAGQVEPSVWSFEATGSHPVAGKVPAKQRVEQWVTDDTARSVTRDAVTGKLINETFQDPNGLSYYIGATGQVRRAPAQPFLAIWSQKTEADLERSFLDRGRLVRGERTTFGGKPALELVSPGDQTGDEPGDKVRSRDLVDPETLVPYEKVTDVTDTKGRTLHQVRRLVSFEVVAESSLAKGLMKLHATRGAKAASKKPGKRAKAKTRRSSKR